MAQHLKTVGQLLTKLKEKKCYYEVDSDDPISLPKFNVVALYKGETLITSFVIKPNKRQCIREYHYDDQEDKITGSKEIVGVSFGFEKYPIEKRIELFNEHAKQKHEYAVKNNLNVGDFYTLKDLKFFNNAVK